MPRPAPVMNQVFLLLMTLLGWPVALLHNQESPLMRHLLAQSCAGCRVIAGTYERAALVVSMLNSGTRGGEPLLMVILRVLNLWSALEIAARRGFAAFRFEV